MFEVAIDFDGTIVDNQFPKIGSAFPGAIDAIKRIGETAIIYLYTARKGQYLIESIKWLEDRGVKMRVADEKPNADIFIDDRSLLGLPVKNGVVDWKRIELIVDKRRLEKEHIIYDMVQ